MAEPDDDRARDPSRREFFRTFSRDAVRNVGAAVGAAAELRRSSAAAARELLDLGTIAIEPEAGARRLTATADDHEPRQPAASPDIFRSPYRFTGDNLVILEQRELPGRVTTFACRDASQVASAIRAGALNGGPVLAEVGAYTLAMVARAAAGRPAQALDQHFRAAASTLRAARHDVRALAFGVERSEENYQALTAEPDAAAQATERVAEGLRATADELAAQAAVAHAEVGRLAGAAIAGIADRATSAPPDGVIHLLMHGDMGPLSCGLVGAGTAALMALAAAGRRVHVWLTEAAPGMEGARIGTLQLSQLEVPHTIISDSAVGWLFTNRQVRATLLRGDRVCANGDTGTVIGGLAVARLAASASVPVLVLAPSSAFDPSAADGSVLRTGLSSASERVAASDAAERPPTAPAVAYGARLSPQSDVVPAALIERIVSEGD